jgi:hypothetical protein
VSAFDVLELPPGWAVPHLEGLSIDVEPRGQRLSVQRDGIYFETHRVSDLVESKADLEDIEALARAMAEVRDPQKPFEEAQLFIDPSLGSGMVMRVLATARRAGWFSLSLAVTRAPESGYATDEWSMLPPPPPLRDTPGWFEIVVDFGDTEIRVGEVPLTGAMPKSGDLRGLGTVTWLAPEPRGPGELERLARRLSALSEELRAINVDELRIVHLSASPERPFAELIAALPIAENPICPERPGRKTWERADCDHAAVMLRAGPPPSPAIDELIPNSFLQSPPPGR